MNDRQGTGCRFVTSNNKEMFTHLKTCPHSPAPCPRCQLILPRYLLEIHVNGFYHCSTCNVTLLHCDAVRHNGGMRHICIENHQRHKSEMSKLQLQIEQLKLENKMLREEKKKSAGDPTTLFIQCIVKEFHCIPTEKETMWTSSPHIVQFGKTWYLKIVKTNVKVILFLCCNDSKPLKIDYKVTVSGMLDRQNIHSASFGDKLKELQLPTVRFAQKLEIGNPTGNDVTFGCLLRLNE